jgi:hypothetical protein
MIKGFRSGVAMLLLAAVGCGPIEETTDEAYFTPEEEEVLAEEYELSKAQIRELRCATTKPSAREVAAIQSSLSRMATPEAINFLITIPVVYHVISKGPGLANGDVPEQQLVDQITVLNKAYAKTKFRFKLKSINRVTNAKWFTMQPNTAAEIEAKKALRVGNSRTLNFYTAKPGGGLLGWATFPWWFHKDQQDDGVVVIYTSLPGGSFKPFDLGHTATHEVGHWLGLWHTFQGGCGAVGDTLTDTPAESSPASGCPIARDTCSGGGTDPVTNYMDYSDDACMTGFTSGQSKRMERMTLGYRRP